MAKKTVRATNTKPNQQRSKEEQWRKRMAAQAQVGGGTYAAPANGVGSAVADTDTDLLDETNTTERIVPSGTAASARTATTAAASRPQTAAGRAGSTPAAARRPIPPRGRLAQANIVTIEEEMHFVKRDISRLVVLTVICLAIIIVLAFFVPSIVK